MSLTIALISDVFPGPDAARRLTERLNEARALGAELALLPELPLNPWVPASKVAREEDAEAPEGQRHRIQSEAARTAGIGLVGGAIVRDAAGRRHNTALSFDARGDHLASYAKIHLPDEPGFWETSHYEPGTLPPRVVPGFALPFGVQICSDVNRPQLSHLLGAQGALAILAPRATERAGYELWKVVFRANALTSGAYVLSVNRPAPEHGVLLGGPSIAVDPAGQVLLETTDAVAVVTLSREVALRAREDYPGYLAVRADLYARAWAEIAGGA